VDRVPSDEQGDDEPPNDETRDQPSEAELEWEFWTGSYEEQERERDRQRVLAELAPFVMLPGVLVRIVRDFRDSLREGREKKLDPPSPD
jgi:hypothetical protein